MAELFFISDTHFQHEAIITKFDTPRPFSSIEEHDEILIQNWNKEVPEKGAVVIHCGDFMMGQRDNTANIRRRLNGKIRICVGNHDDPNKLRSFDKAQYWYKFKKENLVASHMPLHPTTFAEKIRWDDMSNGEGILLNIHGHTHFKGPAPGPYVSVCVEMTDYKPVHISEIRKLYLSQQNFFFPREKHSELRH